MAKILVIEDNSNLQCLLSDFLEAAGFQTVCTNNGRMGITIARTCYPDLILSDVRMPEMDGYSVLETLRQDIRTATIPFIFLTAEPDVIHQLQTKSLFVDDCLSKPINPVELIHSIQQQLAKRMVVHSQSTVPDEFEVVTCSL